MKKIILFGTIGAIVTATYISLKRLGVSKTPELNYEEDPHEFIGS